MRKIKREMLLGLDFGDEEPEIFLIQSTIFNSKNEIVKRELEVNPKVFPSESFILDYVSNRNEPDKYKLTIVMSKFLDGSIEDAENVQDYIKMVIDVAKDMRSQLAKEGWVEFS